MCLEIWSIWAADTKWEGMLICLGVWGAYEGSNNRYEVKGLICLGNGLKWMRVGWG